MATKNLHDNDHFYYVEGVTTVKDILKTLAKEFTETAGDYKWTLQSPTDIESITDTFILKAHPSTERDFYVKFHREEEVLNRLAISYSDTYDKDDLSEDRTSPITYLAWYNVLQSNVKDWLPVSYWISMTKDSINLVLRGDPAADIYPYDNYLTAYMYAGILTPLDPEQVEDKDYNFAVTTCSNQEPTYSQAYGPRTATGTTDVSLMGNKAGMPFQPHYAAFYTPHQFLDILNIEGSAWNKNKHQFSDITLLHPIDMERGKMKDVLVGDASALYDNDKLVYKQYKSDQEMYKKFKITAPFSFLSNTANQKFCIAIRTYNDDREVEIDDGE